MNASLFVRRAFLTFCLAGLATGAPAQTGDLTDYTPQVGQEGKDVVWVPTPDTMVQKMLEIANVTKNDSLIDLGSGDGRTVIGAVKRGARAIGVEYNPDMVAYAKKMAAKEGVGEKAQFVKADLFETDLSKYTVITMFLLPDINLKLRPKILNLKPGTRIVSNSFTMGEWKADQTANVKDNCTTYCTALLWVVPAKVEGTWQLKDGELKLKQQFQMLTGTLTAGGKDTPVTGQMRGDQIAFKAGSTEYSGSLKGAALEGTAKGGSNGSWSATKK